MCTIKPQTLNNEFRVGRRKGPARSGAYRRLAVEGLGSSCNLRGGRYLPDPEIESYITSVKKKYQKHAMPLDEVRRLVDSQMGKRTLTEFLYDARE